MNYRGAKPFPLALALLLASCQKFNAVSSFGTTTPIQLQRPHPILLNRATVLQREKSFPKQFYAGRIRILSQPLLLHETQNNINHDNEENSLEGKDGRSYDSSGSFTKGIVSSLTSITNFVFDSAPQSQSKATTTSSTADTMSTPPSSSSELMQRISNEYTQNNYLWTGNIDTSSFVPECRFTDPTLSFVGVDKFVSNVGNLVPIVEFLLGRNQFCQSKLLDIANNEEGGYIETRWNMIGELNALPWKPKVDVIGRTKFWYKDTATCDNETGDALKNNSGNGDENSPSIQVFFYDEMWEIPAGVALLQLVTPAGTIANSDERAKA